MKKQTNEKNRQIAMAICLFLIFIDIFHKYNIRNII